MALPFLWQQFVHWRYDPSIYTVESAPAGRVAIVFGARVYRDGRLSSMVRDRVDTAIELYQAGKVQKLIMSGGNPSADYDEPGAMMAYAVARGVPAADIQPDYGGYRTYDTCYRAARIFQLDAALLVTQGFHLPRALFTCDALGVDAVGVIADRQPYHPRAVAWSETREIPALLVALLDVIRRTPPPILGEPIPLF
jgi:SanA protein